MMSVEDFVEFDGLTEEQQDIAQTFFNFGYEDGYDEGYETCELESSSYDDGKATGFQEGLEFERQRIYSILDMQMKWAEQEGKGSEYLRWKNVKEYLTPIDIVPWTDEEWQQKLNAEGY